MGVQIEPTNFAMDLTGLLFVPRPVTQITDITIPEKGDVTPKYVVQLMYVVCPKSKGTDFPMYEMAT